MSDAPLSPNTARASQRLALTGMVWIVLALGAIALAFWAVIRPGNTFGEDEWPYVYTVLDQGSLEYIGGRPAEMIYHFAAFKLVGAHPYAVQGVVIGLMVIAAVLIYALIALVSPQDQGFAFLAAVMFIVFTVDDDFHFRQVYMIHRTGSLIFVLGAVWLMLAALKEVRWRLVIAAMGCAAVAILSYEGVLPLIAPLPFAGLMLWRGRWRERIAMLGVWTLGVVISAAPFLASLLGVRGETYGTGLLVRDRLIIVSIQNALFQIRYTFNGLEAIRAELLYAYAVPVVMVVSVFSLCWLLLRSRLTGEDSVKRAALWLAAGAVITVLGFAAFLPTILGNTLMRVHAFARVGEAIMLAGGVWLVGALIPRSRWALAALIVAYSAMHAASLQAGLLEAGAGWSTHSGFLRSLANQAPQVEDGTLILYLPPDDEYGSARFVYPFSFQYAMQYLYDDRASGFVVGQAMLLYTVEIDDAGIMLAGEHPYEGLDAPKVAYGWDEVMVITQVDGRAVILDTLPDALNSTERAALYDPRGRIEAGFVPERVRDLLPPVWDE